MFSELVTESSSNFMKVQHLLCNVDTHNRDKLSQHTAVQKIRVMMALDRAHTPYGLAPGDLCNVV